MYDKIDARRQRLIRKSGRSSRSLRHLVRCSAWKPEGKLMTEITENRNFDLNIEKVLEGWETCHAVRELIANALDEQMLTHTRMSKSIGTKRHVAHSRFWTRFEVRTSDTE